MKLKVVGILLSLLVAHNVIAYCDSFDISDWEPCTEQNNGQLIHRFASNLLPEGCSLEGQIALETECNYIPDCDPEWIPIPGEWSECEEGWHWRELANEDEIWDCNISFEQDDLINNIVYEEECSNSGINPSIVAGATTIATDVKDNVKEIFIGRVLVLIGSIGVSSYFFYRFYRIVRLILK